MMTALSYGGEPADATTGRPREWAGVSLVQAVVASAAVFSGALLNGITGFGFALLSIPVLLWALPPASVVFVVTALGTLTTAVIATRSRQAIDWRVVGLLLPGAVVGLWIGTSILGSVPPETLELVANLAVIVFALLLARRTFGELRLSAPVLASAGALSGALTTSIGLGGPPTILALSAAGLAKDAMRSTLAAFFATNGVIGLALLLIRGLAGTNEVTRAAVLVLPSLMGLAIGSRLAERLTNRSYRLFALGVLIAMGVVGVASAVWGS